MEAQPYFSKGINSGPPLPDEDLEEEGEDTSSRPAFDVSGALVEMNRTHAYTHAYAHAYAQEREREREREREGVKRVRARLVFASAGSHPDRKRNMHPVTVRHPSGLRQPLSKIGLLWKPPAGSARWFSLRKFGMSLCSHSLFNNGFSFASPYRRVSC